MEKFEMLDEMMEYFDSNDLLEEVIRALDTDTALDILSYISQVHDIYID